MQFTQTGFPKFGQPFMFNTPFQYNAYPEIIGEGNVTTMMSPDGSMQLLFQPTAQWVQPFPTGFNNPNLPPSAAWFVRRVFSPQSTNFNQTCLVPNGADIRRIYNSDCFMNTPPQASTCAPNFELKFHNDICTSTSDIHYFYPNLRSHCGWLPDPNACVPVQDVPMAPANCASHNDILCTKPCNCTPKNESLSLGKVKCSCAKTSNTSVSSMSCETDKSEENCCHRGKQKKTKKEKKSKKNQKHQSGKCECNKKRTCDKSVTTYADQACGSAAEKGRVTQTSGRCTTLRQVASIDLGAKHIKTELWSPKTESAKKAMKIKSSENFKGVCKSGCCSGSSNCHSDTD